MATRLSAFVASALGHADVDRVYRHAISPVLRKLHIGPVRVDLLNYNEDIDDKILQLIKDCDICIADLTYARPSVYYEAGYASALGKPVIYIVRRDHFHPNADDIQGNLRVHFDLQMKNIIPWSAPNDAFKRTLKGRARMVTRPLLAALKKRESDQWEELEFTKRPITERVSTLRKTAWSLLRSRRFSLPKAWQPTKATVMCSRIEKRVFQTVLFYAADSVTQRRLHDVLLWRDWKGAGKTVVSAEHHAVLASMGKISPRMVSRVLPYYSMVSNTLFKYEGQRRHQREHEVPFTTFVHLLDAIRSYTDFKKRMQDLLAEFSL
jgi:nucleoside 2-deoxyribosyltransferase